MLRNRNQPGLASNLKHVWYITCMLSYNVCYITCMLQTRDQPGLALSLSFCDEHIVFIGYEDFNKSYVTISICISCRRVCIQNINNEMHVKYKQQNNNSLHTPIHGTFTNNTKLYFGHFETYFKSHVPQIDQLVFESVVAIAYTSGSISSF